MFTVIVIIGNSIQDLLNNPFIVDCLVDTLDIDYPHLQQSNWKHLAEELKAPQNIIEQCKCYSKHSPTLDILGRPNIKCKNVQDLIDAVGKAGRDDVLSLLKNDKGMLRRIPLEN